MGCPILNLEPGSLYITISTPVPLPYAPPPTNYNSAIPESFDPEGYETCCINLEQQEEFDWGLYWHEDARDGVWYMLDRNHGSAASLTRHEMKVQSPRLLSRVVGLIRVLQLPSEGGDDAASGTRSYLDWLTERTAAGASRTFMWAASVYLRTRRHLAGSKHVQDSVTAAVGEFDIHGFLWEALDFAYSQVWYGLAGQLPRPIIASDFGIQLLLLEEEEKEKKEKKDSEKRPSKVDSRKAVEEALLRDMDLADISEGHLWAPKARGGSKE